MMENEKYEGQDFYCDRVFSGKQKVERLFETENILAFYHTKPFWEHHIVVVPKLHISSLLALEDEQLILEVLSTVKRAAAFLLDKTGAVRVLTNLGEYQDSKHLHFHVISGRQIRD
jgi:histidine triad (HIT) family protein